MTSLLPLCLALLGSSPPAHPGPHDLRLADAPSGDATAWQEEEEVDTRALWKVAKNRRLPIDERVAALGELAQLGPDQAYLVAEHAARECATLAKARAKAESRIAKDFIKVAPRLIEDRLGKKEEQAVEGDRQLVLKHARSGGLTKEVIVNESDPALERLRALLVIEVPDVFALDEKLGITLEKYDNASFEEGLLRDVYLNVLPLVAADPALERRTSRWEPPADPVERGEALQRQLAREARLATPMTKGDRNTLEENARLFVDTQLEEEEARGIRATNDMRILLGLGAVRFDEKLGHAARSHSKDMVEHEFFAHDSPLKGRETPWKRAAQAGTSASAENIAAGQSTGHGAIQAWWHSPGHHKNMLGGHARIGLGRHENHWTQLFGG